MDGWVEVRNGEQPMLEVIHDTITDELLILHLEAKRGDEVGEVEDILNYAFENQALNNCLRAFERISDQIRGVGPDMFFRFFQQKLIQAPETFSDIRHWLGVTSLINEEQRVHLFLEFSTFFKPYIESKTFAYSLSFAMNVFSKQQPKELLISQIQDLFQIWYAANPDFHIYKNLDYKIISTYIKLFGSERTSGRLDHAVCSVSSNLSYS